MLTIEFRKNRRIITGQRPPSLDSCVIFAPLGQLTWQRFPLRGDLKHPRMKYYFGKMTIYPDYDKNSLALIQRFLYKHFPDPDALITPKVPYRVNVDGRLLDLILRDQDFKQDYRNLKDAVRRLGTSIPPLVNSYMNSSPTMKMFGSSVNDEFFDSIETGILVDFDEMYADKRDRHKEPYLRHMAESIRRRFPNFRQETNETMERLRRKVQRKRKKEKVEP